MKIRVKIDSEADVAKDNPEAAKRDMKVEIHERRGDAFNVATSETLMEGDEKVFMIPMGGRIILTAPNVAEVVYDREQGAAVRLAAQNNTDGRADAVDLDQVAKDKQIEADAAKQRAKDANERKSDGAAQATPAEIKAKEEAEGRAKAGGTPSTPQHTNPAPVTPVQHPAPGVVKATPGPNPSNKKD